MVNVYSKDRIILSGCLIFNDNNELLLLYRTDHNHYETPGGKVELEECDNPENPSIDDLARTAKRELHEELGDDFEAEKLVYFGNVSFTIPDGRLAIANKFATKIISGTPKVNEPERFSKYDYLPVEKLEEFPISPDLKLLVPKLKKYLRNK
jgi:8-oxo-dGTP pyrophosphatase MutT (NUDIX family)